MEGNWQTGWGRLVCLDSAYITTYVASIADEADRFYKLTKSPFLLSSIILPPLTLLLFLLSAVLQTRKNVIVFLYTNPISNSQIILPLTSRLNGVLCSITTPLDKDLCSNTRTNTKTRSRSKTIHLCLQS